MDTFEKITWLLCFLIGFISMGIALLGVIDLLAGTLDAKRHVLIPISISIGTIFWVFAVVVDRLSKHE